MRKDVLKSPLFLISLALLLLNDLVLKQTFHNWFTGKISDCAGLTVFAIFFTSLLPRYKNQIFFSIGICFIFWKSPLSDPLISAWSNHFYSISRTVDYTDLLALIVLPLIYSYQPRAKIKTFIGADFSTIVIIFVSLFAFCATSKTYNTVKVNDTYYFSAPPERVESFLKSIANLSSREIKGDDTIEKYACSFDTAWRYDSTKIIITLSNEGTGSKLLVKEFQIPTLQSKINYDLDNFDRLLINSKDLGFKVKRPRFILFRYLDNFDPMAKFVFTGIFMFVFWLIFFILNLTHKMEKFSRLFNIISIILVLVLIMGYFLDLISAFMYVFCLYFLMALIFSIIGWSKGIKPYKNLAITGIIISIFFIFLWMW
jgi:hypothetical protein